MNIDKIKSNPKKPNHIALIIDGNGRWAKSHGLPRSVGHKFGADNIKTHIDLIYNLGIKNLSIFAFSCENWNRPQKEVDYLMKLFEELFDDYIDNYLDRDIRFIVSGNLNDERIPTKVRDSALKLMKLTSQKTSMIINICINYGGKQDILQAVNSLVAEGKKSITMEDIEQNLYTKEMLPLDFVIRTSGESRLSNFMLWQTAYSELCFYKKYWPAFKKRDLINCINDYLHRERRFGGIK